MSPNQKEIHDAAKVSENLKSPANTRRNPTGTDAVTSTFREIRILSGLTNKVSAAYAARSATGKIDIIKNLTGYRKMLISGTYVYNILNPGRKRPNASNNEPPAINNKMRRTLTDNVVDLSLKAFISELTPRPPLLRKEGEQEVLVASPSSLPLFPKEALSFAREGAGG